MTSTSLTLSPVAAGACSVTIGEGTFLLLCGGGVIGAGEAGVAASTWASSGNTLTTTIDGITAVCVE